MKYSFLIPYHNRAIQFSLSITSYEQHYKHRNDIELIVIEDKKNFNEPQYHSDLLEIIKDSKLSIKHLVSEHSYYNPAYAFNMAATVARGTFLLLTNPEILHRVNILSGLDAEFDQNPNAYVVCSCKNAIPLSNSIRNLEELFVHELEWYQHSQQSNRLLHFCSAISKTQFQRIGGFDERYNEGIAFEDDDFRQKILSEKEIAIIVRDDLLTLHLKHDTSYQHDASLTDKNKDIFLEKWEHVFYTRK